MTKSLTLLIELRKRLIHIAFFFCVLFALFFLVAPQLFHWYILPLLRLLPHQDHVIATQITTPLLTPLNIAVNSTILCTLPFGLYQLWRFVSPALYPKEQHQLKMVMISSVCLFILGTLFGYFIVIPLLFRWIIQAVPKEVLFLPDMNHATNFINGTLCMLGLSFQIPLVCAILVHTNHLTTTQLITIRPYIIVAAFVLGMLLTPPDVLSQILLAVPLWGLYELGICASRLLARPSEKKHL